LPLLSKEFQLVHDTVRIRHIAVTRWLPFTFLVSHYFNEERNSFYSGLRNAKVCSLNKFSRNCSEKIIRWTHPFYQSIAWSEVKLIIFFEDSGKKVKQDEEVLFDSCGIPHLYARIWTQEPVRVWRNGICYPFCFCWSYNEEMAGQRCKFRISVNKEGAKNGCYNAKRNELQEDGDCIYSVRKHFGISLAKNLFPYVSWDDNRLSYFWETCSLF